MYFKSPLQIFVYLFHSVLSMLQCAILNEEYMHTYICMAANLLSKSQVVADCAQRACSREEGV